jgi:hypothetical protein
MSNSGFKIEWRIYKTSRIVINQRNWLLNLESEKLFPQNFYQSNWSILKLYETNVSQEIDVMLVKLKDMLKRLVYSVHNIWIKTITLKSWVILVFRSSDVSIKHQESLFIREIVC